ncbi:hypothetical protein AGMMS49982_21040 [Bacteroidia bacterium]|nr:hypothetical protein AGMMS49982_21040 [Bacteroidia bacterium]
MEMFKGAVVSSAVKNGKLSAKLAAKLAAAKEYRKALIDATEANMYRAPAVTRYPKLAAESDAEWDEYLKSFDVTDRLAARHEYRQYLIADTHIDKYRGAYRIEIRVDDKIEKIENGILSKTTGNRLKLFVSEATGALLPCVTVTLFDSDPKFAEFANLIGKSVEDWGYIMPAIEVERYNKIRKGWYVMKLRPVRFGTTKTVSDTGEVLCPNYGESEDEAIARITGNKCK